MTSKMIPFNFDVNDRKVTLLEKIRNEVTYNPG